MKHVEEPSPKEEQEECQIDLPLPPKIISLAEVDFRVNGQPSEGFHLEANHLIWEGPLNVGKTRQDRRQLFRHRQGGLHARKTVRENHRSVPHGPGRQPQQHPHVGTLAAAEQARALQRQHHLHLGLQSPGRGPPDRHRHAWHRGLGPPRRADLAGTVERARLRNPLRIARLGHDPEKLNVWLVILVAGCFAGAYPMMYFLQDFTDLTAAVALANVVVLTVIGWRVISLFGFWRGLFGGIVLPAVLMGLTLAATIQAKPAMQGVLLTVMGIFGLVTAMILLPRAQANLLRSKQDGGGLPEGSREPTG